MKELVTAAGAAKAIGPYSPALKAGNMVFLSGSIPLDPVSGQLVEGGITEQTTRVLENIKALLAAAGTDVDHVVRTTVFMIDLGEFGAMNEVYSKYFSAPYPARSTVQVARLPRDVRVEIDVIAVIDN
jgi:2-iminobutanoate/2-iminopropanoate deaminase